MGVCVKSLALHSSHCVWLSAIELFIVTNHKPFNDQVQPLYTHSSIHPAALNDMLVCWALSSITSVSWAGDFKCSTCLSISSAHWASQARAIERERERGRRHDAEGKGNLTASVLWSSGLSLTLPVGLAWRTPLVLPSSPASSPLQQACTPPGPNCTLQRHIDFLEGQEKCGCMVRVNEGGRGKWRNRGSFLKHWLLLDCSSRCDNPVRTTRWPWCPAENY